MCTYRTTCKPIQQDSYYNAIVYIANVSTFPPPPSSPPSPHFRSFCLCLPCSFNFTTTRSSSPLFSSFFAFMNARIHSRSVRMQSVFSYIHTRTRVHVCACVDFYGTTTNYTFSHSHIHIGTRNAGKTLLISKNTLKKKPQQVYFHLI